MTNEALAQIYLYWKVRRALPLIEITFYIELVLYYKCIINVTIRGKHSNSVRGLFKSGFTSAVHWPDVKPASYLPILDHNTGIAMAVLFK